MNVYDFDKTIYKDDSSIDFYMFCLKQKPALSKYWMRQARAAIMYKQKRISKTEMKTIFYEYLKDLDNLNELVNAFWETHMHKINTWYYDQKRADDIVVSASPEFLLQPVADELGFKLIGSIVDPRTGRNLVENCYGDEKVRRFREYYDLSKIESFYSDSYSDDPLAQYAQEAFLVTKNGIKPW